MTGRRIAMWSGPRTISTALMRSWGNRPDTTVVDEPLYGCYLAATGRDHPGRDEVIASMATDWQVVVAQLLGPIPGGHDIWYAKHMAHHLLPHMGRDWIAEFDNCLLVRDPRGLLPSLARVLDDVELADTGLTQQVDIFGHLRALGRTPIVIDAQDVLEEPPRTLGQLCEALDVAFDEAMLSWPPGLRDTDGVWAPYWYDRVAASTGFEHHAPSSDAVPDHLLGLLDECMDHYLELRAHRLSP